MCGLAGLSASPSPFTPYPRSHVTDSVKVRTSVRERHQHPQPVNRSGHQFVRSCRNAHTTLALPDSGYFWQERTVNPEVLQETA